MSFALPSIATPLWVSVALPFLKPFFDSMTEQTGLFIKKRIKSVLGMEEPSITNLFFKEMLTYGISTSMAGILFSGVGREIYKSYEKMNNKQPKEVLPQNAKSSFMLYTMIGILGFVLHWVGIREVQEYIQNNKKLEEENSIEYHDALKLLQNFKENEDNSYWNKNIYKHIIELLYKDEPYYSDGKGLKPFRMSTYRTPPSVFRIIFNILVGLSTQINYVFGSEENHGVSSFKWITLFVYYEALCVILRIPSIAPISNFFIKNVNTDYILKRKKSKK